MSNDGSPGSAPQPPSGPDPPSRGGQAGMKAGDRPAVQRAGRVTEWGKQKYAGSLAESVWRRLESVDFINQGMLFAATLLLCFVPFLIVTNALAGRPTVAGMVRHMGLNTQAAAQVGHLFASPTATSAAVTGTTSVVFFVLGGTAAAAALQQLYERLFDLDRRGMKDMPRRLIWLAVLVGGSFLAGWYGSAVRHAAGPVLLAVTGLAVFTGFWWFTLWLLLAGRISWRALFPCACATGVFWLGMEVAFSLFLSDMVISEEKEYGPIGIIFALMAFLIAIGIVIILGAVVGLAWQERGLSFTAAFRKLRPGTVTGNTGPAPTAAGDTSSKTTGGGTSTDDR